MKSFAYRMNEKLNTGNSGFSLPEIIVAMLLVGIVIVPILTNFAVTARVNAKSLKTKDVTDYAEQIVETLQSYTPDEVDAQFGGSLDDFDIADISVKTDFGRTNSSFAIGKNDDNSENATTEKAAQGEPRYYYIRGAKAPSGRTYDVQITYDPRSYATAKDSNNNPIADGSVHAYNLEEFPDSAAFSRSSTAVINPNDAHVTFPTTADGKNIFNEDSQSYEFVNNTSYEENAINGFYGVYTAFVSLVRDNLQQELNVHNLGDKNTVQYDELSDGKSEEVKKAELRKKTNRYTVIMIEQAANGKAVLSSYMQFQFEGMQDSKGDRIEVYKNILLPQKDVGDRAKAKFEKILDENNERVISDDKIDEIVSKAAESVAASRNSDIVPCYKIFYNDDGYNELNTVYLMMKPLSNEFNEDRVAIRFTSDSAADDMYDSNNRLEIYIVPQVGLLKDNKDPVNYEKYILTSISNKTLAGGVENRIVEQATNLRGDLLSLYYAKGWLNENANFQIISNSIHDKFVKVTTADLIYDVKVTLYESSSGSSWGKKLTELNTSTQQ